MAYSYVYKPVENCRLLIKSVCTKARVYQPLTDIAANIRKYQEAARFTVDCSTVTKKDRASRERSKNAVVKKIRRLSR